MSLRDLDKDLCYIILLYMNCHAWGANVNVSQRCVQCFERFLVSLQMLYFSNLLHCILFHVFISVFLMQLILEVLFENLIFNELSCFIFTQYVSAYTIIIRCTKIFFLVKLLHFMHYQHFLWFHSELWSIILLCA
jgi:hypothetical protein